jgi:hypothetical protein
MNDSSVIREFKYKAFISYSHRDRRTAEWLHRSLENYQIPKQLIGSPGRDGAIPKRLFPIFRDRDELSTSSDLSVQIQEALEQSANLIVICSKSGARSRWVNQEIILFKRLGRARCVHALIIDGEPNAVSPDEECFPQALRFKVDADGTIIDSQPEEPIAADLRPEGDGKDDAKIKLLAGVLGISFNALRKREVIAARRRRRITRVIAGTIGALVLAVGFAGWLTWYTLQASDETVNQILNPGVRVERHATTMDLSGWKDTTQSDIDNRIKKSLAISTNKLTVVKAQEYGRNYGLIVGASSAIPPEIICQGCKVEPRTPDKALRTAYAYRINFDLSKLGMEESQDLDYAIKYWNSFRTPDQWWAGFVIQRQTELAEFTIIFPQAKHPLAESLQFSYRDTKDHPHVGEPKPSFERDDAGLVSKIIWNIPRSRENRVYRVQWDWRTARKRD